MRPSRCPRTHAYPHQALLLLLPLPVHLRQPLPLRRVLLLRRPSR